MRRKNFQDSSRFKKSCSKVTNDKVLNEFLKRVSCEIKIRKKIRDLSWFVFDFWQPENFLLFEDNSWKLFNA